MKLNFEEESKKSTENDSVSNEDKAGDFEVRQDSFIDQFRTEDLTQGKNQLEKKSYEAANKTFMSQPKDDITVKD